MSDRSPEDQLTKYLTDVHSIEVQALAQLKAAPEIAGDERLVAVFADHLEETREHERLVRGELEGRGADTSNLKDIAGRVGGWAMVAFARLNPDTPGKLTAHAFSYEHMELAAYELLARAADRVGDDAVVELARRIGAEEHAMADRLADCFDQAVEASLREKDDDGIRSALVSYLTNAHAIEALLARQGASVESKIYPGQGHGFAGSAERDATERAVRFLRRHLLGGERVGTVPLSAAG